VAMLFNPPPGWPSPPDGFAPGPGWQPDPSWPPAPPGWQLWVPDDQDTASTSGLTTSNVGYPRAPALAGFPEAPPMYAPKPPSGTDGMASAALVLGLLGFVWICAILGIVFGIIARNRTRQTFQRGRGQATAGIVLGSVWLALYVAAIVVVVAVSSSSSSAPPAPASGVAGSQAVKPWTLTAGACFDMPNVTPGKPVSVPSVVQILCTQPHNAQIFATFNVSGSFLSYPGVAKLSSLAGSGCATRAPASLDSAKVSDSMSIRYLYPEEASWLAGVRTVSCVVYNPTPTLTSSLLKS
jgi:Domain of unknown function (DUF4190)/Septum formation